MTPYIVDPDDLRTSTEISGLTGHASYSSATERLTGVTVGEETGLEMTVNWAYPILAFPSAVGHARGAVGGRGGTVRKVTNLNDSGAGSFRAAVEASGPRIVVFEVSGIINLASELDIDNDYITIAGQTSPGGICVTGYTTAVKCNECIIRHMRFRVGSHRVGDGADPETLDSLVIWGPQGRTDDSGTPYTNIIIDHCSVGWGLDECFSTAYDLGNVTISNNLIHEGLTNAGHPKGEHSKGLFIWAKYSPQIKVTLYNNAIIHCRDRVPLINTGIAGFEPIVDAVNNVAYNFYGGYAMGVGGSNHKVNWRHNFSKGGPSSNTNFYEQWLETSGTPWPSIYVLGNMGKNRLTQTGEPEWLVASSWRFELQDEAWRTLTPHDTADLVADIMLPSLAETVVENAGVTVPARDSVENTCISDFINGVGSYRSDVSYPGDFPTYPTPAAPTDTSKDGIPDTWAIANGLNPAVDNSATVSPDGYTWIERYINELAGD